MCWGMAKGGYTHTALWRCAITWKKALLSAPSAPWAIAVAASALGCQTAQSVPRGCPFTVGLGSTRRCSVGVQATLLDGTTSCESSQAQSQAKLCPDSSCQAHCHGVG